ncbi:MAG: carboxylating nicotinate-nucleotide diphosphorylase [Planctomycetota bacterium]|nr:carboxylating nicotinate-nucleotide diphosphorylase [Planctomycetota bacterium]
MNRNLEQAAVQLIQMAYVEDLGPGMDATSFHLVDESATGEAKVVARQSGVVCGLELIPLIVRKFSAAVDWQMETAEGQPVSAGAAAVTLRGRARDLLTLERTLLNFMGRLSGVATLTNEFVELVKGTQARIYDTRKTTPGWRRLEKYAVQCGGGCNHRMGLYDAVLIKDNHLAAISQAPEEQSWLKNVSDSVSRIRTVSPGLPVQVEVDSLEQFKQLLSLEPDMILLDNMSIDQLEQAVSLRADRSIELEASGGVSRSTVRAIAETGVDRISVGGLTHSAIQFDWGLDWSGLAGEASGP